MSAAPTTTPTAPEFLDHAVGAYASISHGRRIISWTLSAPDGATTYRNSWGWAHLEVAEREPWKGEPLSLRRANRRDTLTGGPDQPFTNAARAAIERDLTRWIARVGFDALWDTIRRARVLDSGHHIGTEVDRARREAADARRVARWYDDLAEILDLYANGACTVVPLPTATATTVEQRDARRVAAMGHDSRPTIVGVAAELHANGEHVGYLNADGNPLPLGDDLNAYWNR